MRQKTYLPPRQQWLKCAEIADRWASAVQADANDCPRYPGTIADGWFDLWKEYEKDLYERHRPGSCKTDWALYVYWVWFTVLSEGNINWTLFNPWRAGIVLYNTRHFVKGDFVLLDYIGRNDRHPVWSVTSKGHRLNGYYCETNRWKPSGLISIISSKSERIGFPPEMRRPTPWSRHYPAYLAYMEQEKPPTPENVWILPQALEGRHLSDPDVVQFMVEVQEDLLSFTP